MQTPLQVGPYRLERVLGRGGMGIVYQAYDQRLDRQVAIKRILTEADDGRLRERLRREARTTAKLAHPAIIQVFDLLHEDGCDWIVMELVEGTSLAHVLEAGPLGIDETLRYARQIAEGLAAAHRHGIVHRDLKAENVMVLPDGRVKILDFGIAKRLDFAHETAAGGELTKTGGLVGTSRSMAPEQARGAEVGPRSDLFSFGVLLYEALTGISPFRAVSPVETLSRVLIFEPESVDELAAGVPRPLADLVERLLRKVPELRPASAEQVLDEILRLIEERRSETRERPSGDAEATLDPADRPTASAPGGAARRAGRSVRRAPWVALAAVVVLALAVSVFIARTRDAEPGSGVARSATDDPLRLYEDGMSALRRIDRPENVDAVIATFRALIDRDAGSAAAYAGLARAYWEKSRNASAGGDPVFLEQALAMAGEAVRLDPYLAAAHTSLGLVEYARGRHEEAAKELALALELDPTEADAFYGLGKLAEAQKRSEDAEQSYRRATALRREPLYYDALGALLYDHGRYAEAEAALLESLALAPDNIYALRNLGTIYFSQGRVDEAAAKIQSALKIRPNASLYSNLGTIYFSRGLYSKAAAAFEDALHMDGAANRYIFWLNLGDAYRQIPGKEAAALEAYRRALLMLDNLIAASPGDVRLLSRRALVRVRSGDREGALADVALLRRSGTGGDLYSLFRLAVGEELCGERARALASLEAALRAGFPLAELRNEPDLESLRTDVRFHRLLVALGETG